MRLSITQNPRTKIWGWAVKDDKGKTLASDTGYAYELLATAEGHTWLRICQESEDSERRNREHLEGKDFS